MFALSFWLHYKSGLILLMLWIVYTVSSKLFCTTCFIFSAQIASQLPQVYKHINFLFDYMILLKKLTAKTSVS